MFLVIAVAIAVGSEKISSAFEKDVVEKVFGGKPLFDAFSDAQTVQAQRIHQVKDDPTVRGLLKAYTKEKPVVVPPEVARELKTLLQSPKSYVWKPLKKECLVDYGVLLTFGSGKTAVRVAVCFNCNDLGIFEGEDDNARAVNKTGEFDPMRPELVSVMKLLFPEDEEIQGIN
jgi:hypothetical protein